jgi:hypothetical protein
MFLSAFVCTKKKKYRKSFCGIFHSQEGETAKFVSFIKTKKASAYADAFHDIGSK